MPLLFNILTFRRTNDAIDYDIVLRRMISSSNCHFYDAFYRFGRNDGMCSTKNHKTYLCLSKSSNDFRSNSSAHSSGVWTTIFTIIFLIKHEFKLHSHLAMKSGIWMAYKLIKYDEWLAGWLATAADYTH